MHFPGGHGQARPGVGRAFIQLKEKEEGILLGWLNAPVPRGRFRLNCDVLLCRATRGIPHWFPIWGCPYFHLFYSGDIGRQRNAMPDNIHRTTYFPSADGTICFPSGRRGIH